MVYLRQKILDLVWRHNLLQDVSSWQPLDLRMRYHHHHHHHHHHLLDATGIRVFLCNFRNHSLFSATSKNSPTARCVLAVNLVFNDVDFFRSPIILLKQILNWNLLYWVIIITIIIITIIIAIIIITIINVHTKLNRSVKQILSNLSNFCFLFFVCVCVCVLSKCVVFILC
jgi:hypothetical protein